MYIIFQNLQCMGESSSVEKTWNILNHLPKESVDLYLFVELGLTNGDDECKSFGKYIFNSENFVFDRCNPHKIGDYYHRPTEFFAFFQKNEEGRAMRCKKKICRLDLERRTPRASESFGTRQPAFFEMLYCKKNIDVMLYHPSPTNAVDANILLLTHLKNRENPRPFIVVGDFNMRPDKIIPTRGRHSLSEFRGNGNLTLKNLAEQMGFKITHSMENTHRVGVIDYVLHSSDLCVKDFTVVDRAPEGATSDHNAISFQLEWKP